jgi:DNA-binding CsgD family transcriptional regulator
LEQNPRVFWGRVVKAFLKAGWNPPDPGAKVTDAIVGAIKAIEAYGEAALPHRRSPSVDEEDLTARELEVMMLLADGYQMKDVAAQLGLAIQTVKFHQQKAARKLGARNTVHAVALLFRRGSII